MKNLPKEKDYPRRIKLNRHYYKVIFDKYLEDLGECCFEDRTITIRSGLSERELLKTYIHELIHAIECEFKFDLNHKHVYKLEKGFYDFIRANIADRPFRRLRVR